MIGKITWKDFQRIKDIKVLDLEICDYRHVNILNLGWKSWGKWYCKNHEREHVLCPKLCLLVSKNILGCELVRERIERTEEPVKPNKPYDWANCYLCGKELKGAGKTGKIKNRNDPKFWGISSEFKILCLNCLERRYYTRMVGEKKKMLRKYLRRGYE